MEGKIAALLFLSFMSLEDFKEKSVSLWKILLFLTAGMVYLLVFQTILQSQNLSFYTFASFRDFFPIFSQSVSLISYPYKRQPPPKDSYT